MFSLIFVKLTPIWSLFQTLQ